MEEYEVVCPGKSLWFCFGIGRGGLINPDD